MSDTSINPERKRWRGKRIAVACAAILLIYAFSIGPAWRLAWSHGNFHFLLVAYRPFIWASESCRPFFYALEWYLRLWTP
jgi:hypothetical protein